MEKWVAAGVSLATIFVVIALISYLTKHQVY